LLAVNVQKFFKIFLLYAQNKPTFDRYLHQHKKSV